MNQRLEPKCSAKLCKPKLTASLIANVLVVTAIIFIPLMYGGILSSAYQDPVERINHIQAAIVNEDEPYKAELVSGETKVVDVGEMLTDALVHPEDGEDTGFTWTEMGREEAEQDLADASVRAILYIPSGLSEEVSLIGTADAADAVSGRLELVTDDGINYLAGTLARTVAATLQDRVSSEASEIYAEALLDSLEEIRTGMGEAADGAVQLAEGSANLSDGLQELDEGAASAAEGSAELSSGANQLADGLGEVKSKVPALEDGVNQLAGGTSQLATGASSLNSGISQYTDGVGQVTAGAHTLRSKTPALQQGLQDLQDGADALEAGSAQLRDGFNQISEPVAELEEIPGEIRDLVGTISKDAEILHEQCVNDLGADDRLCDFLGRVVGHQAAIEGVVGDITGKADEAIAGVAAAQEGMDQIAGGAEQLDDGIKTLRGSIGTTSDGASNQTVLGAVNAIDDGLTTLSGNSAALKSGASQVASGSAAVASGTGQLKSKVPTLVAGVNQLDDGAGQVAAGAGALSEGLSTLSEGMSTAAEGAPALVDGSEQLSEGLNEGLERIPRYSSEEAEKIAETSSTLVQVEPVRANEVHNSGAGFSPMFISLALWIGGIAVFLVLPALDRRPGPGETWWMAAVRPARTAAVFAVIQATLAVTITNWLVELHAVHVWGMVGIAILASLTFVAVNQACIAMLGYRGRFVSIVLLLLQIASMGATFPVETMPAFFNWIHPWLPMTYTQLSFRAMIAGSGTPGIIPKTIGVLLLWLDASAALVLLGAYLRTKNHPLPYDAALLPDNYPDEDQVSPAVLAERKDLKKEIVEDGRELLEEEKAKLETGKAKIQSGKAKLQDGKAKLEGGKAKLQSEKAKLREGRVKLQQRRAKLMTRGIVAGHSGTLGTVGPRSTTVTPEFPEVDSGDEG